MPRALALRHVDVPGAGRAAYLTRLAERVAGAKGAAFHLWAFEAEDAAGRFVEFVEARDAAALSAALAQDAGHARVPGVHAPAWQRYTGVADS